MDAARNLVGDTGPDPASASDSASDPASELAPELAAAILDRLDGIGRLLAGGAAAPGPARPPEVEPHLVTRIDMLGRIVEQLLADREEADARLAALTRRLVDLEGTLAPALDACAARVAEAVPLLAESALERMPGGGVAVRVALRGVHDAIAALDRRLGPSLPPSGPWPGEPERAAPARPEGAPLRPVPTAPARPASAEAGGSDAEGPAPAGAEGAPSLDDEAALRRLLDAHLGASA